MNTPVKFPIAKLLKEKGFKQPCFYYYDEQDKLKEPFLENGSSTDTEFRVDLTELLEYHNNSYSKNCSAPTISEVVMWLYEKHNLWITVMPSNRNQTFFWLIRENAIINVTGNSKNYSDPTYHHTPTEAYEAAIEYVLNKMIS